MILKFVQSLFAQLGFEIRRKGEDRMFRDIARFLAKHEAPLIVDIGANMGQTIQAFKKKFPESSVHAFEPSPSTFEILQKNCANLANVQLYNLGVGSANGVLQLIENEQCDMSSFLEPGETCWGNVVKKTNVEITRLDYFCEQHNVSFIDVLKSDTQGFELEVFKGASRLFKEKRIGLIYFEAIFSKMYREIAPFHETYNYLSDNGFILSNIYDLHYKDSLLSWTDFLFINRDFYLKTKS